MDSWISSSIPTPDASVWGAIAGGQIGFEVEDDFEVDTVVRSRVLVRAVRVKAGLRYPEAPSLVKFSAPDHVLSSAPEMYLATPGYYRRRGEDSTGIGDTKEASYDEDIADYLTKNLPNPPPFLDLVTGTATYRADRSWMFCTSLRPQASAELDRMMRRFRKDAVTLISRPNHFARALGKAVSHMETLPITHRSGLDVMLKAQSQLNGFERIVLVDHGRVAYPANPEHLINAIPVLDRGSALPFIKRTQYAWQKEYRFTVTTTGTPSQAQLQVPITQQLRSFASLLT